MSDHHFLPLCLLMNPCLSSKSNVLPIGKYFRASLLTFLLGNNLDGFRVLYMPLLQGFKHASVHSLIHLVIYHSFTKDSVHFPRAGALSRS